MGETLPFTAAATGALIAAAIPSAIGASTRDGGAASSSSETTRHKRCHRAPWLEPEIKNLFSFMIFRPPETLECDRKLSLPAVHSFERCASRFAIFFRSFGRAAPGENVVN